MYKVLLLALAVTACGNKSKDDDTPTLINGTPVKPGEYPEVVYISMGGGRCTATLVGPESLLTAAHCAENGQTVTFQHEQNQYSAVCTRNPRYPRVDIDIAACKLTRPISADKQKFASVGDKVNIGDMITIAGYGCTRPGGGGGNDGVLRSGDAKVTGFTGYDIISKFGVALCFGDSGGPLFKQIKDPMAETHYILGVNSKGNIRDTNYNLRLDNEEVREFLKDWADKNKVEMCGITKDCGTPDEPAEKCQEEMMVFKFYEKRALESKNEYELCLDND